MFSECANPLCRVEFDYGQGQFFRFRKAPLADGKPANTHSIQHYWLCGECAKIYRLEYQHDRGILLKPNYENAVPAGEPLQVGVA
jgi:hypothetical protein